MSVDYARAWQIGYAKEVTYGTEQTPSGWIGLCLDATVEENPNLEPIYHSNERGAVQILDGQWEYGGSLTFLPQDGKFIAFALGTSTVSGTQSPYTHTVSRTTVSPYTLPSMTLEYATGDVSLVRRYTGVKLNRMSVAGSVDRALKVTVDWLGQDCAKYTTKTEVTPDITTVPYRYSEGTITINTVSTYECRSFTLTYDNSLKRLPHIGSETVSNLAEGRNPIECSFEMLLQTDTLWDLFADKTGFNAEIKYARTTSDYVEFKLANCRLKNDIPLPEDSELLESPTVTARSMTVELKDGIDSYPTDA